MSFKIIRSLRVAITGKSSMVFTSLFSSEYPGNHRYRVKTAGFKIFKGCGACYKSGISISQILCSPV